MRDFSIPESEDYTVVRLEAFRISCPRCGETSGVMLARGQYNEGYQWMNDHAQKCANPKEGDSFQ